MGIMAHRSSSVHPRFRVLPLAPLDGGPKRWDVVDVRFGDGWSWEAGAVVRSCDGEATARGLAALLNAEADPVDVDGASLDYWAEVGREAPQWWLELGRDCLACHYEDGPEDPDLDDERAVDAFFRARGLPDRVSDYDQPWYRLMASSYIDRP